MNAEKYYLRYDEARKRIAINIVNLRKSTGMTLEEASIKIQMSSKQLETMEQGHKINSVSNLLKIANGYEVDIQELFKK